MVEVALPSFCHVVTAATPPAYNNRWRCELCGSTALPYTGYRHHCRACKRTVCDGCSFLPERGERRCHDCHMRESDREEKLPREKYIFLVRHAQSKWNQNVDLVKKLSACDFKDVVSRAASLPNMAREVLHTDHPISEIGVNQTGELRHKIVDMGRRHAEQQERYLGFPSPDPSGYNLGGSPCSPSSSSSCGVGRSERESRYYERFLMSKRRVYCSPLLRALQTAHLALRPEDGWGKIELLKDAREIFKLICERDCIGADGNVGAKISKRAMRMGQDMNGLDSRVDASDCLEKWWSDEPETDAAVETRLKALWRRLLDEDTDDSCVLVTHSNLIKAIMMHFSMIDSESEQLTLSPPNSFEAPPLGACHRATASQAVENDPWQVIAGGSEALQPLKTEKLQNCGVIGLRCVLDSPPTDLYKEVDGWIDCNGFAGEQKEQEPHPRWVAIDALLMFDSILVK